MMRHRKTLLGMTLTVSSVFLLIWNRDPGFCACIQFGFHGFPGVYNGRGLRILGGVSFLTKMLVEVDREMGKGGEVEAVKPDYGLVISTLFISALLAVVVPVPSGRDKNITRPHSDPTPLNGSETSLSLDDEPDGEGSMSMGRSYLVGLDQLQTSIESVGGERRI